MPDADQPPPPPGPPPGWEDVRRVLAVRLDNIGDVVMCGPALRALRRQLPAATLDLLCSPGGAQAVPLLPWVDEALTHRALWQDISATPGLQPEAEQELVARLGARGYDAAVIFTSFAQSPHPPAYVCYLAGIPLRLGQSKEFAGGVLTHWLRSVPDATHQVDRSLALLEHAGFRPADPRLELCIPPDAQAAADAMLAAAGVGCDDPFIVLAPGASASSRRYAPERFARAAQALADTAGLALVLVGGPRELALVQRVERELAGRAAMLAGRTSVAELAAVIARARLLVSNNSSPPHLADAVGCPIVLLFAGTELESQWRPRASPTRTLRRPTPCSPCYRLACPYGLECLEIAPEEVASAGLELLGATAAVASGG